MWGQASNLKGRQVGSIKAYGKGKERYGGLHGASLSFNTLLKLKPWAVVTYLSCSKRETLFPESQVKGQTRSSGTSKSLDGSSLAEEKWRRVESLPQHFEKRCSKFDL